ncbi:MAG: ribonuclease J, partial [Thermoplasmata archaeon]
MLRNARELIASFGKEFAIADFGPRNIERLEIFLEAARESRRRLVVTTKDAYLLHAMRTVDPATPVPGDDILIYDSPKGVDLGWEEWVLEQYSSATVRPEAIRESPGDYLVAFSFFDIKHLVDLRPDGGHYIYSSSEAFNEEMEIDFRKL